MAENYPNPPITEAICEFRVSPDTPWDLTVPGSFYERVQTEFPLREQRKVRSVELVMTPEGLMEEMLVRDRMMFSTADRSASVQVGPGILAVHVMSPYPSWSRFRPRIEHALRTLTGVVDVKGLQGINLRYINVVQVPGLNRDPEEYFLFLPRFGCDFPTRADSFIVGCELPFFDGQDACRVEMTDGIPDMPDATAFLINIDYFLAEPGTVPVNLAMDWLDRGHERAVEIFEACINDRLREIFRGNVKEPAGEEARAA
jgi:uncharacterized protein (TIGR04255 family)